jgi:hypothetical protein
MDKLAAFCDKVKLTVSIAKTFVIALAKSEEHIESI